MRTTVGLNGPLLERARQEAARRGITLTNSATWKLFQGLCKANKVTGNLVQDAWLAALAIESGCEWMTTDGDFARFRGLSCRSPF